MERGTAALCRPAALHRLGRPLLPCGDPAQRTAAGAGPVARGVVAGVPPASPLPSPALLCTLSPATLCTLPPLPPPLPGLCHSCGSRRTCAASGCRSSPRGSVRTSLRWSPSPPSVCTATPGQPLRPPPEAWDMSSPPPLPVHILHRAGQRPDLFRGLPRGVRPRSSERCVARGECAPVATATVRRHVSVGCPTGCVFQLLLFLFLRVPDIL